MPDELAIRPTAAAARSVRELAGPLNNAEGKKDHWARRLTTTLTMLLELAGEVPDRKVEGWQMQVGLYQLSIAVIAPAPQITVS